LPTHPIVPYTTLFRSVLRRESVRIFGETLLVHGLELDREIRRAAVVGRIEAVGFAAGRAADLNDLDVDAAQRVDDRLARRARGRDRKSTRLNSSHVKI